MNKLNKRINVAANVAIVVVLVLIGGVLVKRYAPAILARYKTHDYRVPAGTRVSLSDVDWSQNGETLLLVLDTKCAYCTASAPFYQQLARQAAENGGVQLVAVLPQAISESKQYLSDLNVPINDVRQATFEALLVQGTPTLILVDRNGEVEQSWAGKLPPEQETELLKRMKEMAASKKNRSGSA